MKTFATGIALLIAAPGIAQTAAPAGSAAPAADPAILDRAINTPGTNWQVYGATQKSRVGTTQGVPGDQAMRVDVSAKGANPWDVGAMSPIQKAIGAGDVVLVAAYMRAPALKDGETTPIPFLGANDGGPPYEIVGGGPVAITSEWKLYYASGKASRAFPAGSARVAVHLAGAKHVVELGPVFVLDFGPNYDPAKLPRN